MLLDNLPRIVVPMTPTIGSSCCETSECEIVCWSSGTGGDPPMVGGVGMAAATITRGTLLVTGGVMTGVAVAAIGIGKVGP